MPSGINKGDSKTLTFNIPDEIPAAYFPLECVITARNLEPTNASRNNLRIESNADGSIDYIYTATRRDRKRFTSRIRGTTAENW